MKDFLVHIEKCHMAMAELYTRLGQESDDEKVKLLLNFMKHKEQLSYQYVHEYVQQAPVSILEAWLDKIDDQNFPMRCQELRLQSDLSLDDVISLTIDLDTELIELLKSTSDDSPTPEIEVALEKLSKKEEKNLHQVIKASLEFEHM